MHHEFRGPPATPRRRVPGQFLALVTFSAAIVFLIPSSWAAPDLSTPKKAGLAFAKAVDAGDMDSAHQVAVGTDKEFAILKGFSDTLASTKRFEAAVAKKFGAQGKSADDKTLADTVEEYEERINGDKATLFNRANPTDKHPMILKQEAGVWKVDLTVFSSPDMAQLAKVSQALVTALDATTKDVEAGKFKTGMEAKTAMGMAMMKAIAAQEAAAPPAHK